MYGECCLSGFEWFWTHFGSIPVGWGEISVYGGSGLSGLERFWTLLNRFLSRVVRFGAFRAFRFGRVQVQ